VNLPSTNGRFGGRDFLLDAAARHQRIALRHETRSRGLASRDTTVRPQPDTQLDCQSCVALDGTALPGIEGRDRADGSQTASR
jgi:hypothetical protein